MNASYDLGKTAKQLEKEARKLGWRRAPRGGDDPEGFWFCPACVEYRKTKP